MTYADIVSRLEAAEGADRELDIEIVRRCISPDEAVLHERYGVHCYEFTGSLDAAIGLVERLLPDWYMQLERRPGRDPYAALGMPTAADWTAEAAAATLPLALLLALFRALEAEKGR